MLALQEAARRAEGPDETERRTRELAQELTERTIDFATFESEMMRVKADASTKESAVRVLQMHKELQEAAQKVKELEDELASLLIPVPFRSRGRRLRALS